MNKTIQFCFNVHCPGSLLCWVISIAFVGSVITVVMMHQAARFTLTRAGLPVSQQKFHRIADAAKVRDILNSMSEDARQSMRNGLNTDFGFMLCAYGLMISVGLLLNISDHNNDGWKHVLYVLCWLPLIIYAFDLLEDVMTLSLLRNFKQKQQVSGTSTMLMAIGSYLKWLTTMAWIVLIISYGIGWLIAHA